jgi:hypothetical protein
MASLDDIESGEQTSDETGKVDLLVGIAGPVNQEELSSRAEGLSAGWPPVGSQPSVAFVYPAANVTEAGSSARSWTGGVQLMAYPLPASTAPVLPWMSSPAAYRGIAKVAEKVGARACVILSQDLAALDGYAIEALAAPILEGTSLLTMPIYPTAKYEGLLNSSMLYPFTRALYGKQIRHPLALDFGVGGRMIAMLAAEPSRGGIDPVVWPSVEGVLADGPVTQVYLGTSHSSQHDGIDLSAVLGRLGGALFENAEKNAALWQRIRGSQPAASVGGPMPAAGETEDVDVRPLIESFNLGLRNLRELWGLVLPPVTLLELKRMGQLPAERFRMADALWAKIVYDFALAHRLRTISRTHLLGALTPLYLGWVASYAAEMRGADAAEAEERIERLAKVYEETKSYFVSRWRWPDRFNP